MSDLEIYRLARNFFEGNHAVDQVFVRLPKDTQINLLLDGRFEAHLLHDGTQTRFAEGSSKGADFELNMSAEALRRVTEEPPDGISGLLKALLTQGLRRDLRWKTLISKKALIDKGYVQTVKDLGPLLQGEASQTLLIQAGKALAAFESIKSKFKR